MRHLKRTAKLGRTGTHRNAMLANLVCSLIIHKRDQTTLSRAKAARSVAEKMVTLGKSGTIHDRRLATARLHTRGSSLEMSKAERKKWRETGDVIHILFDQIAPVMEGAQGRLHPHHQDAPARWRCRPTGHPRIRGIARARRGARSDREKGS